MTFQESQEGLIAKKCTKKNQKTPNSDNFRSMVLKFTLT